MSPDLSGIAIVGMGLRFPGAETPERFWRNLQEGIESLTRFSPEELMASGIPAHILADPNYIRSRFILPNAGEFDSAFFDVSAYEAEITDPQFRVFLQCAWEAIEHAGYDLERYPGLVGVYAGSSWSSYLPEVVAAYGGTRDVFLRNDKDFLATWTSYKLNLRGPSLGVQSYCSTSLAAVHLACHSLWNFECDMALAGGVSINIPLRSGYYRMEGDLTSSDGHCRSYSADATGMVFGDGAGVVLLKRLGDALDEGDFIHAVIRGSAINNDGGARVGYMAPSVDGQYSVITQALANANLDPRSISYIEGHGTGTLLGDAIEVRALNRAFSRTSKDRQFCALGSVKPNVGHLDRAAGVSSLIKTALALHHHAIPPTLFFEKPNPDIDFACSPFYVTRELKDWPGTGEPRRAGVTSLGIGGTNVHIVLEEAPPQPPRQTREGVRVLSLSARTPNALSQMRLRLADHLRQNPDLELADVAYTLQVGRRVFAEHQQVFARTIREAIEALNSSPTAHPLKAASAGTDASLSSDTFDWEFPDEGEKPRRVPLPTYPFERTLHWVDAPSQAVTIASSQPQPLPPASHEKTHFEDRDEERLANIWEEVLGQRRPGREDRFLDFGGHSVAAARVASRIQDCFGVQFETVELFESPTIAALAVRIRQLQASSGAAPISRASSATLSFGQQRIWFLDQIEKNSSVFNIAFGMEIEGDLNVDVLERAFTEIIRRHEQLRTIYKNKGGQPVAEVLPPTSFTFEPTRQSSAAQLAEEIQTESRREFDLSSGPLIRARIFQLSEHHCFLLLVIHHISCDGWSLSLFGHEISQLYNAFVEGRPSPLPPLEVQYSDFAACQREQITRERREELLAFWRSRLENAPSLLPWRGDLEEQEAGVIPFHLSASDVNRLQKIGTASGATLFMVVLTALKVVLHRFTGESDICVGAPLAGRYRREWEQLIGFFINTLVLRTDLSGTPTFRELLLRCRHTCIEAYRHQDMPFEMLVTKMNPERHSTNSPLFQVLLILQSYPLEPLTVQGLTIRPQEIHIGQAHSPLVLQLTQSADGIHGIVEFDHRFLTPRAAEGLTDFFLKTLREAARGPERRISDFRWLEGAGEPPENSEANPNTGPDSAFEAVHHRVLELGRTQPEKLALRMGLRTLTYGELGEQAGRLARILREAGTRRGDIIGLHGKRSLEWIVGMLGILCAGAAYLPLDPSHPLERRRALCVAAGVKTVLSGPTLEPIGFAMVPLEFGLDLGPQPKTAPVHPSDLAYVLYTSGSTGQPKGVMVHHEALVNLTQALIGELKTTPEDCYLQFASLSWDTSIEEIFPCLCMGATLQLRDEEMLDPSELCHQLAAYGVTFMDLPTAYWHTLVSHMGSGLAQLPATLHTVLIGGEAAREASLSLWRETVVHKIRLLNSYGATEITAISLICELRHDLPGIPLGRILPGCTAYVLDRCLHPVPIGIAGELYVGGLGVSQGYLGRPDLTAEWFLPDGISCLPGQRMYRTGDLVVRREDGLIEFVGRLDRQIKIRGHRVEPAEIESLLRQIFGVEDAAVVATGPEDRLFLAACFASPNENGPDEQTVRQALSERLPEFLIPSRLIRLKALPQTPSGKVDLAAIAAEAECGRQATAGSRLDLHPHEEILGVIWSEVLQRPAPVSAEADFFDLGGHSLLAIQLVARIREVFRFDFPIRSVFEYPSLGKMSQQIWIRISAGAVLDSPPTKQAFDGTLSVSLAQQRLWFLQRMFPDSATYNMPVALHHQGPLDTIRLGTCFDELVRRHEPLHSVFAEVEGQPVLRIVEPHPLQILVVDLRALDADARLAEAWRIALEQIQRPFDLACWPLFRIQVIRLGDEEYGTILTMHHIIADAWSLRVLAREMTTLYEAIGAGRSADLPFLPIRFSDFAQWQRKRLSAPVRQSLIESWQETLEGLSPLRLPYDFARSSMKEFRGSSFQWTIAPELEARLRAISREEGATLFMTLLSGFAIELHQYSGQLDFAVGFPVTGRGQPEIENLIGFFVNTLVIRCDLSGHPTFRELIRRIRARVLDALAHQDLPFEELVDHIRPRRTLGRNPLFQVCFSVNSAMPGSPALEGQQISPISIDTGTTKFDLSLSFTDLPESLSAFFEYDSSLFAQTTIREIAAKLESQLELRCDNPDLRIECKEERCPGLSGQRPEWLGQTIPQLIEAQVRAHPDLTAVVFKGKMLTYRQLDERARRISHALQRVGAGPENRIGLRGERSIEMVVALLGILQAGCAWVPIDPDLPEERQGTLLREAQVMAELPDPRWVADETCPLRPSALFPENMCYLIYTSGSTGTPKGVITEHGAISSRLLWMRQAFQVVPGDRILHKTPVTFDVSVWELLLPLISGATMIVAEPHKHSDMGYLADLIAQEGVTMTHFVPSVLREFMNERDLSGIRNLRCLIASGETLPTPVVERFFERLPGDLFNLYGPTEASVDVTAIRCKPGGSTPIGWPIANVRIEILDSLQQPVPMGTEGEICIGGIAPARGYFQRPDLTAAAFVPDPVSGEPGARLYRTGDRGRIGTHGVIEYLGRIDSQIKLRGFRIEPEEIEAALREHPSVSEAAVVIRDQGIGDILEAFVVPSGRSLSNPSRLRDHLLRILPTPMVPARIHVVESIPLTPHGKMDRPALLRLEVCLETSRVAPHTKVEMELASLWSELLNEKDIGIHDNFFELGGHSLLLARLASRIQFVFGAEVGLAALFEGPTISEMIEVIAIAQLDEIDEATRESILSGIDGLEASGDPLGSFSEGTL